MRRLTSAAAASALLVAIVVGAMLVGESSAELENQVFTSRAQRIRMVVPKGWPATDQPSYPGLLLWMTRTQPPGQLVLTAEAFTRELYCSFPPSCRSQPSNTARYACALRDRLGKLKIKTIGNTQLGPRENELAGLSSVWFDYDDGKRFMRHAVAVNDERAFSLVLSAGSSEARATHSRAFDQALRTLQPLTAAESAPIGVDAAIVIGGDAIQLDATTLSTDAGPPADAGVQFESAPVRRVSAIGTCPADPKPTPKR